MNKYLSFVAALLLLVFVLVACPSAKDTTVPELTLSPATTASSRTFTVEGTARDTSGITYLTVQVNDAFPVNIMPKLATDGTFSAEVALDPSKENTITVVAKDDAQNATTKTLTVKVELAASSISGHLWNDANANGEQDAGEANLVDRVIFLDQNDNGVLDDGEVSVKTDAQGNYRFTGLAQDKNYIVRQVLPFGEQNIFKRGVDLLAQTTIEPQIVGGTQTTIDTFPFMVAVTAYRVFDGKEQLRPFCGATLLTNEYVLTAAHCVEKVKLGGTRVMLSADTLDPAKTKAAILPISEIILHPKYQSTRKGYDVALLKLEQKVELKDNIYTIDLLTDASEAATDTLVTAVGWGKLYSDAQNLPDDLHVVHTKIFDHAKCEKIASSGEISVENFETQLCAGVPEGGVDACQGDSGGPLLVRKVEGERQRWLQVGITSWGNSCAQANSPGVWADIPALKQWIMANTSTFSLYYAVHLGEEEVKNVDFANQINTRPFHTPAVDRWQVTTLSYPEQNTIVESDKAIDFSWKIFADNLQQAYVCKLIVSTQTENATSKTHDVPCKTGDNTFRLAEGVSGGLHTAKLELQANNISQSRQVTLASQVSRQTGSLQQGDLTDPDYTRKFYIDHFEMGGVPENSIVVVTIESSEPSMNLWVYDKSKRSAAKGGGAIYSMGVNESPLFFRAEPGVTYLLGASTGKDLTPGDYTIISTAATLTPYELE